MKEAATEVNAAALGGERQRTRTKTRRGEREKGGEGGHGKGHFGIERLYSAEQRSLVLKIVGTSDWDSGRVWW